MSDVGFQISDFACRLAGMSVRGGDTLAARIVLRRGRPDLKGGCRISDFGWLGCRCWVETPWLRELYCVAGGRALRVEPVGLFAVGVPAADSLSRIFVRIGCRLDGLPYTIPDSMPGSLDCETGDCNPLRIRRLHLPKQ